MTRTRGHKRNYRDLSEGPINSQLLQDGMLDLLTMHMLKCTVAHNSPLQTFTSIP